MIPVSELNVLEEAPAVSVLQDAEHGFGEMVDSIVSQAEDKLKRLNRRRRVTCPASELVVGVQSGIRCNLRRDGKSSGGLCDGSVCTGRRDGDVL